eukprot:12923-Heterococcus_DN1.PRE.3
MMCLPSLRVAMHVTPAVCPSSVPTALGDCTRVSHTCVRCVSVVVISSDNDTVVLSSETHCVTTKQRGHSYKCLVTVISKARASRSNDTL